MKLPLAVAFAAFATSAFAEPGAYLEITLTINDDNRPAAAAVYSDYKEPFLTTIEGAELKVLLVRKDDVQVLHGFDTLAHANAYLASNLFKDDIVTKLSPLFAADPEIRVYEAN